MCWDIWSKASYDFFSHYKLALWFWEEKSHRCLILSRARLSAVVRVVFSRSSSGAGSFLRVRRPPARRGPAPCTHVSCRISSTASSLSCIRQLPGRSSLPVIISSRRWQLGTPLCFLSCSPRSGVLQLLLGRRFPCSSRCSISTL
jgi:hypothetical protein